MKSNLKSKTFLFYFTDESPFLRISPVFKIFVYILLNCLVLINKFYLLNVVLAIVILFFLFSLGFFSYKRKLFRIFIISTLMFFLISLIVQIFTKSPGELSWTIISSHIFFIFEFISKWLLINASGLLLFVLLSQNELIWILQKLRVNYKALITVTIAFNMISRLLESIDDIDLSLESRGVTRKSPLLVFDWFSYLFKAIILDNIEYLSSLRATFAFDYLDLERKYGRKT